MSERGQVLVKGDRHKVYLYTHWCGEELPKIVSAALAKQWRWTDPEYLTRIIFCQMLTRDSGSGETGFGIGNSMHDDLDWPLITVDCKTQRVKDGDHPDQSFPDFIERHKAR